MKNAVKDWNACVQQAKRKMNIPTGSFVMVEGQLLEEAKRCYCAMGY